MNPSLALLASLSFKASGLFVAAGIVVLALVLFISYLNIKRLPRRLTWGVESLRVLSVLLILFLLLQPEWVKKEEVSQNSQVLILWDDSGSMQTQDAQEGQQIFSRAERVKQILATEFWQSLQSKYEVQVLPFDSATTRSKTEETAPSLSAGTDLNTALEEAMKNFPHLRSVILLSDGDHNKGNSPTEAALKLRSKNIALYTVPLGAQTRLADVSLESVRPPLYAIVGESVRIPFVLYNSLGKKLPLTLTLTSSSGQTLTKEVKLPEYGEYSDSFLWKIPKAGQDTLTLSFPSVPGEWTEKNNTQSFTLTGKPESIKVLFLESEPRWEYRFIRNALMRDPGVEVHTLLTHPTLTEKGAGAGYLSSFPEKLEDLSQYDVLFLGDIGLDPSGQKGLTLKQTELIKGLIENQASGIVFLPGKRGLQESLLSSPLGELFPVLLDKAQPKGLSTTSSTPLLLTPEGKSSLLTLLSTQEEENARLWRSLPGFYWYAGVLRAKPATTILATHESARNKYGKIPLLVTQRAGAGKVLYMGTDSAWRWRKGVEDLYHYRFWGQVARWMAYQRNMAAGEHIRLFMTPERPKTLDTLFLTATISDALGAPLKNGTVKATFTAPDKSESELTLDAQNNTWGVYTGLFKLTQSGAWKVTISPEENPETSLSFSFISQGESVEKVGREAHPEILRELSQLTQGRVLRAEELPKVAEEITLLPQQQAKETRLLLWSHWISGLLLLLLLGSFWSLRKLNGTI